MCARCVCKECARPERKEYLAQKHTSDISNYELTLKSDEAKIKRNLNITGGRYSQFLNNYFPMAPSIERKAW